MRSQRYRAGTAEALEPALRSFAESALGPVASVADWSWEHGESEVWRLAGERGAAVLKVHRQVRKFQQELRVYERWLPRLALRLPGAIGAPILLARRDQGPHALLLSLEPGTLLEGSTLPRAAEAAAHRQAGRFLRNLHGLKEDDADPLPLEVAFVKRIEAWAARAQGLLPASLADAVVAQARLALPFIGSQRRVPCHRDYTPRNWLHDYPADGGAAGRDGGGRLTIIDFEHARFDLYLVDFQRLWSGLWRFRPDLKESFLIGYGRDLTAQEEQTLARLSALWAVTTVIWAKEHGDTEFEETGWEVLRWLGLV